MGWRSWNAFGNRITQDMMHTAIDAITAKNWTAGDGSKISLADAGYASVGESRGGWGGSSGAGRGLCPPGSPLTQRLVVVQE